MRRIAIGLPFLLALALLPTAAHSQITATRAAPAASALAPPSSAEADQVRGWYRDYLGREVGPELSAWVELLRGGMSPIDVQATILGSDEFYYQKGRDPQTFVLETLQAVNWAEPTATELRRWTDRLNQLRGDRFALAREILLASSQPQFPAGQVTDLGTRLTAAARLAVDTIDFEIGGTPQGRQANLQALALQDACEQLRRTVAYANYRPADALAAIDTAERSQQALQTTLSNPPGTAPSAAGIVRRIGTMLADARYTIRPAPTTPPSLPGTGTPSAQVLDQVIAARRGTESLIQMLTSQAYQNYSYSIMLRDLETLAARLASLEQSVRSGLSRERLAWEVQSCRDIAARIRPQLQANRPPYFARLYWQSVESSLEQLRESAGSASGSSSTVLRPTALHESLLPLLDQTVSQSDVFLAGTNPLVFGIADVPRVQRDVRALRGRVLTLRQQAGSGESAAVLKQTLTSMVGDYQAAFDRWNQVVATYRVVNPPRLSPVGETLNRVEQLINDALASGELTPVGPTRPNQLVTSLSLEVAEARRVLPAFAGYREQQSLDLYLGQLADYVQSINDALARSPTVDARRLAVGMQGVIGRMQAEVQSLNQRVFAAGTPELRDRARDLQARIDRLGRLVDDIEASLY
jgi:hypothetical protein